MKQYFAGLSRNSLTSGLLREVMIGATTSAVEAGTSFSSHTNNPSNEHGHVARQ